MERRKFIWWIYVVLINTLWCACYIIVSSGKVLVEKKYNHRPRPGYHLFEPLISLLGITAPTRVLPRIGDPTASGIEIVMTKKDKDVATATQKNLFTNCSTVAKSASTLSGTPPPYIVQNNVTRLIKRHIGTFTTPPSRIIQQFANPHTTIPVTKIRVKLHHLPHWKGFIMPLSNGDFNCEHLHKMCSFF